MRNKEAGVSLLPNEVFCKTFAILWWWDSKPSVTILKTVRKEKITKKKKEVYKLKTVTVNKVNYGIIFQMFAF